MSTLLLGSLYILTCCEGYVVLIAYFSCAVKKLGELNGAFSGEVGGNEKKKCARKFHAKSSFVQLFKASESILERQCLLRADMSNFPTMISTI